MYNLTLSSDFYHTSKSYYYIFYCSGSCKRKKENSAGRNYQQLHSSSPTASTTTPSAPTIVSIILNPLAVATAVIAWKIMVLALRLTATPAIQTTIRTLSATPVPRFPRRRPMVLCYGKPAPTSWAGRRNRCRTSTTAPSPPSSWRPSPSCGTLAAAPACPRSGITRAVPRRRPHQCYRPANGAHRRLHRHQRHRLRAGRQRGAGVRCRHRRSTPVWIYCRPSEMPVESTGFEKPDPITKKEKQETFTRILSNSIVKNCRY